MMFPGTLDGTFWYVLIDLSILLWFMITWFSQKCHHRYKKIGDKISRQMVMQAGNKPTVYQDDITTLFGGNT